MKKRILLALYVLLLTAGASLHIATAPASAQIAGQLTPKQAEALEQSQYALALTAATWGSPAVIMYNLRYNDALQPNAPAKPNDIWRMPDIPGPELAEKAGYVLPNVNVIYGFGFLDLRAEPMVLSLPDSHGLYYMVESVDMWTNAFAYPAGAASGYSGGKVVYAAPGWKGEIPEGLKRIDAPTPWVLLQPRVHVTNTTDPKALDAARKVLAEITVQPLSAYLGKDAPAALAMKYPVPERKNLKLPVSTMDYKDPLQFWELLSTVMNENPPTKAEIEGLLPLFKPLGLELGKQWKPDQVDAVTRKAMAKAAQDIPTIMESVFVGRAQNGWQFGGTMGDYGTDYVSRAYVARNGLTANTIAEAEYFQAIVDSAGQPLTGAKNYTMTFTKEPPYNKPAFWALRMFDGTNYYPVPNALKRYAIGSDNELKTDKDGSITIYLQAENPGKDKESNWLPAPKGPFMLILGTYAPGKTLIEAWTDPGLYPLPPAVEVK